MSEVRYNSILHDFNERLNKWDKAQADLELIVQEDKLDELIEGAADYREKVIKARDNLVSLWIEAHTPEEDTSNHSTTASQSVTSIKPSVNLPRIDPSKIQW